MKYDNFDKINQTYFYIVARTLEFFSPDARKCKICGYVKGELQSATGLRAEKVSLLIELMRHLRLLLIHREGVIVTVEFLPEFWTLLSLFEINSDALDETLELAA